MGSFFIVSPPESNAKELRHTGHITRAHVVTKRGRQAWMAAVSRAELSAIMFGGVLPTFSYRSCSPPAAVCLDTDDIMSCELCDWLLCQSSAALSVSHSETLTLCEVHTHRHTHSLTVRELLMKMKELLLFLSCVLCVSADVLHEDIAITGCSDSDGEDMYGLDGEELAYADFNKQTYIYPLPPFVDPFTYTNPYEQAVAELQTCRQNLKVDMQAYKNPPLQRDAPSGVMIYTRDEVEFGEKNTLICHVTGFYPAPVNVSWTKNGQKVTGSSINVPYPNKDGTFTQISRLQFTPQLGDIYSCAVQHLALTEPLTKIYDVQASGQSDPGVGPSVFCGVGLTLGLLGVAAGTFFLIKGNECS
ncbi:RLA class II histocompatibility antigen, DP alpha-1 chain-like [Simochromis diagramma]|uniref:RLA class II histocompatibility antigen, DP alpha-1 chain-like n=1 Tax=Simochromis diagramma TaxID=43689 RepID=UPI001A7E9007|nr:RLA class II histocompatibility antigen, DP alpha-1 chain-like [Simochromis diagramma]